METSVNNKCRAFTSLEQSRKLAEILPLESADMAWCGSENVIVTNYISAKKEFSVCGEITVTPCWSLTALLGVLPKADLRSFNGQWICFSTSNQTYSSIANNPVDACHKMILKLHELNLL